MEYIIGSVVVITILILLGCFLYSLGADHKEKEIRRGLSIYGQYMIDNKLFEVDVD